MKNGVLETGANVRVPFLMEIGDVIAVGYENRWLSERVKGQEMKLTPRLL